MGFFERVKNAVLRFMYGRNGLDQLGLALLWSGLILNFLSLLAARRNVLAGEVLSMVCVAAEILMVFRVFSKNLPRRRAENQKFLAFWNRLKGQSRGAVARHKDKDHKYFTCGSCKAICRVPVGKGKIVITCPRCGAQIQAKT